MIARRLPDLHFPKQRALFGFRRRAKTLQRRAARTVRVQHRQEIDFLAERFELAGDFESDDAPTPFAADQIRAVRLNRANFGN